MFSLRYYTGSSFLLLLLLLLISFFFRQQLRRPNRRAENHFAELEFNTLTASTVNVI